jgi:hypothetical protein
MRRNGWGVAACAMCNTSAVLDGDHKAAELSQFHLAKLMLVKPPHIFARVLRSNNAKGQ